MPVVVGIDGSKAAIRAAFDPTSKAAIRAAEWAIDEAVSRDVTLRLTHVAHIDESRLPSAEDYGLEVEYAETALRAASAAVVATGTSVKVDTAVLRGDLDSTLIAESSAASMICVGSVGIGRVASMVLGSTAATLAKRAHCPVAIIRTDDTPPRGTGWIAVVVDDEPDNDAVIHQAMEEARLRKAPVLALGVWRWALFEIPYEQLDQRLA